MIYELLTTDRNKKLSFEVHKVHLLGHLKRKYLEFIAFKCFF